MHHAMVSGHKSDLHVNECICPVQYGAELTSVSNYSQITVLRSVSAVPGNALIWSSCEQKQCQTFCGSKQMLSRNDAKTPFSTKLTSSQQMALLVQQDNPVQWLPCNHARLPCNYLVTNETSSMKSSHGGLGVPFSFSCCGTEINEVDRKTCMHILLHVCCRNFVIAKDDLCIWLQDLDKYLDESHHASLGKKKNNGKPWCGGSCCEEGKEEP
jgi:hypothetical protein